MNYVIHKILVGFVLTIIISEAVEVMSGSVVDLGFILKNASMVSLFMVCFCELVCFRIKKHNLASKQEVELSI